MRSAVQLVATGAVDERAVDHDAEPCAICGGESTRGVPLAEFIGPTMTDQTSFRSPESRHACVCCAFVRARYSPEPDDACRQDVSEALRDVPRLVEAHGADRVSMALQEYAALVILAGAMNRKMHLTPRRQG